ncbi:unnamed protein product, partial [Rotaria socialis]
MHEQLPQELKLGLQALDSGDYAKAIEFVSSAKFVSGDIMDTIDEMEKKNYKVIINEYIIIKEYFVLIFCNRFFSFIIDINASNDDDNGTAADLNSNDGFSSDNDYNDDDEQDDTRNLITTTKQEFSGVKVFNTGQPHIEHSYFKAKINDDIKYMHKQIACWLLTGEKKGWSACDDGRECDKYECISNHPRGRKQKCRDGNECGKPKCDKFLHPTPYGKLPRTTGKEKNFMKLKLFKYLKGVWATSEVTKHKLNRAFKDHRNVILYISVRKSGRFQGIARLSSQSQNPNEVIPWILQDGKKDVSDVFNIDWVTRQTLPFFKAEHLLNLFHDGQEVEPDCAKALCRLFSSDPNIDMIPIVTKAISH